MPNRRGDIRDNGHPRSDLGAPTVTGSGDLAWKALLARDKSSELLPAFGPTIEFSRANRYLTS